MIARCTAPDGRPGWSYQPGPNDPGPPGGCHGYTEGSAAQNAAAMVAAAADRDKAQAAAREQQPIT